MKQIWSALCALVLTAALPVAASAQELMLGGQPVGIELQTDGVVVAGFAEVETADGVCSPAREAGLREGDRIIQVGDTPVTAAEDLIRAVSERQGEAGEITVQRGETSETLPVQTVCSADGQWMLGLWLRDQSSGIGTLTFYDPSSGRFGALGHGVTDETSGETLPIRGGRITEAQIVSVIKENKTDDMMRLVKGLHKARAQRAREGKKLASMNERHLVTAEKLLYSEMAFSLKKEVADVKKQVMQTLTSLPLYA